MTDWKLIVDRHGPAVWQTAYRLLNHHADACDCYQETFLAAVKLDRRQTIKHWPAALRTIATCRALDRLRRRTRQLEYTGDPDDALPSAGNATRPGERAEAKELMQQVRAALTQLPVEQAQAFWLQAMEQLSYQEVAAQMNIKPNAVGVLIHRARKRLREILSPAQKLAPTK
jgi:RNA polymerase sigma-70 factor (ECF subfamily)